MAGSERQTMLEVDVKVIKRFMRSSFVAIVPVKADLHRDARATAYSSGIWGLRARAQIGPVMSKLTGQTA